MLDLIAGLRGKATVVMSSHILSDVQEVCDTVGVMRDGRLLYDGPLDELLAGHDVTAYRVRLRSSVEHAAAALAEQVWVTGVECTDDLLTVGVRSQSAAERHLAEVLVCCGAQLVSLEPRTAALDDVVLGLTT